jgi:GTP cyclohydrolase I
VEFEEVHREMGLYEKYLFTSPMFEHHLRRSIIAHVGYIPNKDGKVVGASKLARVVEIVSKRPQIQERMTSAIADAMVDALKPDGVAVVVQAEHLCMIMRGIKKPGSALVTSALRGSIRNRTDTRNEFFCLLQGK